MADLAWWLVAALAVACAVLWVTWRRRRTPVPAPAVAASRPADAPPTGVNPEPPPPVVPASTSLLVPQPGPAAPLRTPVAALVAPPGLKPPTTLVAARARRFELRDAATDPVLTLERGSPADWQRAAAVALTPMQRDFLGTTLAHAALLAPGSGASDLFRLALRAGSAMPLARGELAGAPGSLKAVPPESLDAARGPALAALVLALHCGPVYLRQLRAEVAAIQSGASEWLRRSSAGDERLRALLQDLSRYLREVEENHAGALRKPVFVARVADFCTHAEQQWLAAAEAQRSARRRLESATTEQATREGLWQDYALRGRVARSAARMLAAWHGLRLALGEAVPAATLVLRGVLQGLRAAEEADAALRRARPDEAPGAAAPTDAEDGERARHAVAATIRAIEAGFTGDAALTLLLKLDAQGRVAEARGPVCSA